MGILSRVFAKKGSPPRKRSRLPQDDDRTTHLAFVLLSKARLPRAGAIVRGYKKLDPGAEGLQEASTDGDGSTEGEILSFQFDSGDIAFVALVPAAVPNGEADGRAQFSVSSLGTGWELPEHTAHLIVTLHSSGTPSLLERLSRFTSLLAAVADSSRSVGVYWGAAGATHDSDFFISTAREPGVAPRIMLWSGISIAREGDGRLGFLSLGMQQLNLPDLLLVASESSQDDALETFFDLLVYIAERGEPIAEGDTVGRTAEEKLPVHYVDSPIDPARKVWRVELR